MMWVSLFADGRRRVFGASDEAQARHMAIVDARLAKTQPGLLMKMEPRKLNSKRKEVIG